MKNTDSTEAVKASITSTLKAHFEALESHRKSFDFYKVEKAERYLSEVDSVLAFNEYIREKGNPDDALEDMETLDDLAECGGDWAKPSFLLARAFYGYRFNPFNPDNREAFNPNDEYYTFNGYGNLVSVADDDKWLYYAGIVDAAEYVEFAADSGLLSELADALGVDLAD